MPVRLRRAKQRDLPTAPARFESLVSISSSGKRVMSEIELLRLDSLIPAYRLSRSRLGRVLVMAVELYLPEKITQPTQENVTQTVGL